MGYKPGVRKCARERCRKLFKKLTREHRYCSKKCRDAQAQERLRERARKFYEMEATMGGVMGGND
jgi:hypothetical protein